MGENTEEKPPMNEWERDILSAKRWATALLIIGLVLIFAAGGVHFLDPEGGLDDLLFAFGGPCAFVGICAWLGIAARYMNSM